MTMDETLLALLLSDETVKKRFFKNINGTLIFDKQQFLWFIESKEFLPDSYTKYANKIGLTHNGEFISKSNDVVLDFPYKDCVLEGGQDKDDQKRKEIFYNEIIASDEISRMLAPKVLTNAKRYTKDGVEENITFSEEDNLIIKGNNLIALSSLLKRYEGKVKCIYIDPPYNTGNDSFNYNDSFNHSTWLVFMKNRLELAKKLLSDDGLIFVHCDENEQAYLKVLMDDIFGRENNYGTLIQLKGNTQNDSKSIQKNHEYVLCYIKRWHDLKVTYKNYVKKEVFEDKYYLGRDTGASSGHDKLIDIKNLGYTIYYYEGTGNGITGNNNRLIDRKNLGYTIYYYEGTGNGITGNNNRLIDIKNLGYTEFKIFEKENKVVHAIALEDYDIENLSAESLEEEIYKSDEYLISLGYIPIRPPKRDDNVLGRWTWSLEKFKKYWNNDEVLIKSNKNVIKKEIVNNSEIKEIGNKKYYIKENILPAKSVIEINNKKGTTFLKELFGKKIFNNPKSEELLEHILNIATKENDLILDFNLGSGTTCAVAHKMGRRYIGVEQMDYIEDITVERMKKVLEGEQGGISKSVNWQGGGSFVYCELLENANSLIEKVHKATEENISELKELIYSDDKIVPYITRDELINVDEEFESLALEEKKKALIKLIDKNKLYVNYSDMEDSTFKVSESDTNFTKSFYKEA